MRQDVLQNLDEQILDVSQPYLDVVLPENRRDVVGVGRARTRQREASAFPLGDPASLRETTPCPLRGFA